MTRRATIADNEVRRIIDTHARELGASLDDIVDHRRSRSLVAIRHRCWRAASERGASLRSIARVCGRDRQAVRYGVRATTTAAP